MESLLQEGIKVVQELVGSWYKEQTGEELPEALKELVDKYYRATNDYVTGVIHHFEPEEGSKEVTEEEFVATANQLIDEQVFMNLCYVIATVPINIKKALANDGNSG